MAAIVQRRWEVADEMRAAFGAHEDPSAEGWTTPECRDPSLAEVREPAVVYRIDRRTG